MKKSFLIMVSIIASLSLIACSNQSKELSNNKQSIVNKENNDNSTKDVREVVWSQLSSTDKDRIKGNWKDAKVSKIVLTKDMMNLIKDKSYAGKEVYVLDFPTTSVSMPNNMIVYADIATFDFIGHGMVD